ncbi:MAG: hypothetical protein HY342_10975 [Candidatus Lambdaproteobacteria bacterium]|nr:hypothetical protein [Candidatus Lambdaproteobacteria bacterium]
MTETTKTGKAAHAAATSAGVQALIERLREDGVERGRGRAEEIVREAQNRADWIVTQAEHEAEALVANARTESEQMRVAGEEAIRVAMRDTLLGMKTTLENQFNDAVLRLVSGEMKNVDFLRQLILAVTRRAVEEAGITGEEPMELSLPHDVVGLEELRHNPQALQSGPLSQLVLSVAGEVLREGVTLHGRHEDGGGIHVRLVDRDIEIDLTEQAVATALLQHLQPRFRAIVEGIVG